MPTASAGRIKVLTFPQCHETRACIVPPASEAKPAELIFGRSDDCRSSLLVDGAVVEAWVQRHSSGLSSAEDYASKIVTDRAGNVVIAGHSDNKLTGTDLVLIKYSGESGSLLWQNRYNGPGNNNDTPNDLQFDTSGNIIVAGFSFGIGSAADFFTARFSGSDGALIWEQRYNGAGNYNDSAVAVAVDSDGNVAVTGQTAAGASYAP